MMSITYSYFTPDFGEICMDCLLPYCGLGAATRALVAAQAWEGLPPKPECPLE